MHTKFCGNYSGSISGRFVQPSAEQEL